MVQFKEWGDQYGPIYRLSPVGNTHIIVSTEDAANELLVKRGAIYSGRGGLTALSEGLTRNLATLVMPPNGAVLLSTPFSQSDYPRSMAQESSCWQIPDESSNHA